MMPFSSFQAMRPLLATFLFASIWLCCACTDQHIKAIPIAHDNGECDTWYEQTQHNSSAFRNVKDFGAKGDGVTDDTAAFQKALTQGRSPQFSVDTPLVVYVPPGNYLVSDTLDMYFYTHLMGNWRCKPTIRLVDNAPGFSSSQKYVLTATMDPSGEHVSNFYHQLHNINIDMGQGNGMAIGIHWAVAQATSIRNVTINVQSGKSGMFCENGGGGFIGDLTVIGGDIGLMIGGQQWTLRDITISGSRTAGIQFFWDWIYVLLGVDISDTPAGIVFQSTAVGTLVVLDSVFTNCTVAVSTDYPSHVRGLLLDRVTASRVENVTNSLEGNPSGTKFVTSFAQGFVYENDKLISTDTMNLPAIRDNRPLERRARPTVSSAVNVYDTGAKGDGKTDDTQAIQDAINQHDIVFFPYGTYLISQTINLKPSSVLIGEVWSILMATSSGNSSFTNAANPTPMLATPDDPNASIQLMDLLLAADSNVPGAVLLDWQAGSRSGIFDVHYRLEHTVYAMMHIHGSGGGYFENAWLWTADHDINTGGLINVTSPRGMLVESQSPLWLYGTAVEHNALYQYNFTAASNVVLLMSQTETPYWQAPPSAWANTISGCHNITMYGSGYYSWFNGQQQSIFSVVDSHDINVFAHNVYGVAERLSGDHTLPAVYNDTFCSTWVANLGV